MTQVMERSEHTFKVSLWFMISNVNSQIDSDTFSSSSQIVNLNKSRKRAFICQRGKREKRGPVTSREWSEQLGSERDGVLPALSRPERGVCPLAAHWVWVSLCNDGQPWKVAQGIVGQVIGLGSWALVTLKQCLQLK